MDVDSSSSYSSESDEEVPEPVTFDQPITVRLLEVVANPLTTIVQDQVAGDTAKIIVIQTDGVKRIITFDLPEERCSIFDLVEWANILLTDRMRVLRVEDNEFGINYILECGTYMDLPASNNGSSEKQTRSERPDKETTNEKSAMEDSDTDDNDTSEDLCISFKCRSFRIGSYEFVPRDAIVVSRSGIKISVPLFDDETSFVDLEIELNEIVTVTSHFGERFSVLFFGPSFSKAVPMIRNVLGMHDPNNEPYYAPLPLHRSRNEMIALPEYLDKSSVKILKKLLKPNVILRELNAEDANARLSILGPPWKKPKSPVTPSPTTGRHSQIAVNVNNTLARRSSSPEGPRSPVFLTRNTSRASKTALANREDEEIRKMIVYPPPPAKGGIAINTEDYKCLDGDEYLNDAIINFYLKYLMLEVVSERDRNRTYIFDTFFYQRLTEPRSATSKAAKSPPSAAQMHKRVKKWTNHVDIFEKDFIIIPINENAHWYLAIICFPGLVNNSLRPSDLTTILADWTESDQEEPMEISEKQSSPTGAVIPEIEDECKNKQPCILIFDSLAYSSRKTVLQTLRDYLTCEYRAKHPNGGNKIFSEDAMKSSSPGVPKQKNLTDCGLYVLQYVESFFKNPIKDYELPIYTLRKWFKTIDGTRKRKELADLILRLAR